MYLLIHDPELNLFALILSYHVLSQTAYGDYLNDGQYHSSEHKTDITWWWLYRMSEVESSRSCIKLNTGDDSGMILLDIHTENVKVEFILSDKTLLVSLRLLRYSKLYVCIFVYVCVCVCVCVCVLYTYSMHWCV